jgi:hypothetical protein
MFSPDTNVTARNQSRTSNRLMVHDRGADGFTVQFPTVLERQL